MEPQPHRQRNCASSSDSPRLQQATVALRAWAKGRKGRQRGKAGPERGPCNSQQLRVGGNGRERRGSRCAQGASGWGSYAEPWVPRDERQGAGQRRVEQAKWWYCAVLEVRAERVHGGKEYWNKRTWTVEEGRVHGWRREIVVCRSPMPGRHVGRGGAAASRRAARVQRFQEYRGSSVQGLRRKLWEPQPGGGAGAARQRMLAARSGGALDQSSQHECWSSNSGEGLWWRWGGGLGKLGWGWGKVGGWGVSKGWPSAVPVPAVRILCCCSNQLVQRTVNDGAGVGRGPVGLARRCSRAGGRRGGRRRQKEVSAAYNAAQRGR